MSNAPKSNISPETGSQGTPWPDQIWVNHETGEQEIRPALQESYIFGNPEWPIAAWRDCVDDTVANHMATVLASGTGNGKSIFGPQMFYESGRYRRVFITQPRIVATRENARFTQYQMEQATGQKMGHIIGYRTANEGDTLGPSHAIREHTDGYTLQQMLSRDSSIITKDDLLIIDEAHERNANIDIALALALEKGIRVLIQSASINTEKFAHYCSRQLGGAEVPVLEIPGSMHPRHVVVGGQIHDEIIKYANMGSNNPLGVEGPLNIGALVPGAHERKDIESRLARKVGRYAILHLHGDQTPEQQRRSFEDYPNGKIVLMTDVGRQSITIPQQHVMIDGGYHKIGDYRLGVRYLRTTPVSRAGIEQGMGRISRTMPGIYVHAALDGYPPIPRDANGQLLVDAHEVPPIQRTDPLPYQLKLMASGRDLESLDLMDPPRMAELEYGKRKAVRMGATVLNSGEKTEIGKAMEQFSSLDPAFARMLVEARRYGDKVELRMAAMVAACQQDGGITMTEQRCEGWRRLTKETRSDMLVQLDILAQAMHMDKAELGRHHIVSQRLDRAKDLLHRVCKDRNLDIDSLTPPNEEQRKQLIACIITGADMLFISRGDQQYSNEEGFEGRLPKSTTLSGGSRLLIGTPYALEHYRNKKLKTHRIIKNATAVTAEQLQKYAPWRCQDDNIQYFVDKNDKVYKSTNVYFDGKPLRDAVYSDPEPSIETTRALLQKLFHDPVPHKEASMDTKEIYNEVARLKNLLVDRSDKQEYFDHIMQTLVVDNVGKWGDVKVKEMYQLAKVLHKRNVHKWLQDTLAPASHEAKEILQKSPDHVIVEMDGELVQVPVEYKQNKAFFAIPLQQAQCLENIEEQLDNRQVYVYVDGSKKNFLTLHNAIKKAADGNRATRRAKNGRVKTKPTWPSSNL